MSPRPSWQDKYRVRPKRSLFSRDKYHHPKIYRATPELKGPSFTLPPLSFWLWLTGFALVGGAVWGVFFSPLFRVKQIAIVGDVTVPVRATIDELYGAHILTYSSRGMADQLRSAQSSIDELRILKGLPDTLRIDVTLRKPVLAWESSGQRYFLDAEGIVFQADEGVTIPDQERLPVVIDSRAQPVQVGVRLVSSEFIVFVSELKQQFVDEFPLTIERIEVGQSTFEVQLTTQNNLRMVFDTTRQVDPQLIALKKVFETHHATITEYVDLRIPGRAYFK